MKDEYLSSLIGRAVQVYKGGPDSNVGVLLNVNSDYLTLQKEDGEIIYYKTEHIKSIRENSQIRFNSVLKVYDANNLFKADTFNELAVNFKDQTVRINGKGPESKHGTLLDVRADLFVLSTEADGLIFYKEHYVTSLSHAIPVATIEAEEVEKAVKVKDGSSSISEEETVEEVNEFTEMYSQIAADTTNDLLSNLKYSLVKINRKGPESIEGMLVEANEDYLVLVVNNEIFRISTFHVKNFSVNPTKTEDQESEQTTEQSTIEETTNEITSEEKTTSVVERLSAGQLATSNRTNVKRRRMNRSKKQAKEQAATIQSETDDRNKEEIQITEQATPVNTTTTSPTNTVTHRRRKGAKAKNPREEFNKKRT
jgi:spore coat protein B